MKRGLTTMSAGCLGVLALFGSACVPDQPTGVNQAPVAVIVADPTSGVAPLDVEFTGAGSSDPDGTIASYAWDFGDGGAASSATPSHTFTTAGAHVVTLTVTDNGGVTDTETTTITVSAAPVNQAPTASFTATPDTGAVPLAVSFDSSGSTDSDGTIDAYAWDFGDGATSTDPSPDHTFTTVGSPVVTLTVTDDDGATATTTRVITASSNQPPTAAATLTPASGRAPLAVAFDATASSDPENGPLTYGWDFGDGGTDTGPTPSHTYAAGTWSATLTVTDDRGQTDTRSFNVEAVANAAPVAVPTATPTSGDAPLTVAFDSSGSTDDLGVVFTAWDFDDGGASSLDPSPSHTFTAPGVYVVGLQVADADGETDFKTVTVTVSAPNVPPTAVAVADVSAGKAPLAVSFDGTGSTDPDGAIATYAWDFGDGGSSADAEPAHTFAAGTWTVTLTVTDDDGATSTDSLTVTVVPNQAPLADATADVLTGKAPMAVSFDGTGSTDPDGAIATYAWDFGDGGTSADAEPSHTFAAGTWTVTLTVTDDSGDTDTATLTIAATPNTPPTAAANADVQAGPRPLTVNFSSASVDPDGSIATYAWDFGDGGTSTAENPSHTFAAGTWSVTLTVTDDSGDSDTSDAITITAYVDDDGDGVSPPTDCDDNAAGTYPGAPDALDDGVDADCDGVDGPAGAQLFVRSSGGADSGTCGTPAAPCATIAGANSRAAATGISRINLAGGSYGPFAVIAGRNVRGGYGQNFLRGAAATGSTTSTVIAAFDSSIAGPVGIVATGINTATTISDLTVAGVTGGTSQSSYGIVIRSSNALTLARVTVNAGNGAPGTDGSSGASATQSAANGGGGGEAAEQSGSLCSTSRKSGGGGGTGTTGANGGNGGQGGARDSSCPFSLNSTDGIGGGNAATVVGSFGLAGGGGSRCDCGQAGAGGDGQPGRTSHGTGGTAGTLSVANGSIDPNGLWTFTGGTGGTGTLGLDGTGGGGGGGGGGNDSGTDSMGGGGGGGGAGGLKAPGPGSGGTAGRASIGISIVSSSVTLTDVVVNLGTGGKGGNGGAGGLGQPGGPAGAGGSTNNPGGRGGNGGAGGAGGNSGAGGGGAGGPAIGIAAKIATINGNAVTYNGGAGGAAGSGGTGGVAGSAGTAGVRSTLANL